MHHEIYQNIYLPIFRDISGLLQEAASYIEQLLIVNRVEITQPIRWADATRASRFLPCAAISEVSVDSCIQKGSHSQLAALPEIISSIVSKSFLSGGFAIVSSSSLLYPSKSPELPEHTGNEYLFYRRF